MGTSAFPHTQADPVAVSDNGSRGRYGGPAARFLYSPFPTSRRLLLLPIQQFGMSDARDPVQEEAVRYGKNACDQ